MHDFLARDVAAVDGDGRHRILHGILEQEAKAFRRTAEQFADALPCRQQADRHAKAGITLDLVEDHRRPFAGRALAGSRRTNMAINAGQLGIRIDLDVRADKLAGQCFEQSERRAKIVHIHSA